MIRAGGIPAVAYYRMSSKKQDKSIAAQRVEVEQYAAANGYQILRPYVDEGISGSESEKREGFQQLMHDATTKGDFRAILCWDQDRFSRFDPLEANHYWFLLRNAGVQIVTVRQGVLDLSELGGWLVASINQHGKAQYLKDLSANVLRGRLRKAERGLWAGSRAPYGYAMTKDGRLVLGKREDVRTVNYIFREYADRDVSLRDVARALNERGTLSPSGGQWTGTKAQAILRRETYLGQATQFRESKGKFNTVTKRSVAPTTTRGKKPRGEWFTVDCPQIIDRDLWERCQAKLVRRRGRTSPSANGGLLNGLVHCGHCGAKMHVTSKPLDSSGDIIYCCSTYNSHGNPKGKQACGPTACYRNPIHQAQLVPYLVEKIQELLLAPTNVNRLRAEIKKQLAGRNGSAAADVGHLRTKLVKLDKEIVAAARELKRTPDDLYDLAVQDMRQLRHQREQAATTLEALESATPQGKQDADKRAQRAIDAIQRLGKRLTSADPATVREAFNQVVDRIDLWFDHKHSAKQTRSFIRKGLIRFRQPSGLFGPASRLRSRRA